MEARDLLDKDQRGAFYFIPLYTALEGDDACAKYKHNEGEWQKMADPGEDLPAKYAFMRTKTAAQLNVAERKVVTDLIEALDK